MVPFVIRQKLGDGSSVEPLGSAWAIVPLCLRAVSCSYQVPWHSLLSVTEAIPLLEADTMGHVCGLLSWVLHEASLRSILYWRVLEITHCSAVGAYCVWLTYLPVDGHLGNFWFMDIVHKCLNWFSDLRDWTKGFEYAISTTIEPLSTLIIFKLELGRWLGG